LKTVIYVLSLLWTVYWTVLYYRYWVYCKLSCTINVLYMCDIWSVVLYVFLYSLVDPAYANSNHHHLVLYVVILESFFNISHEKPVLQHLTFPWHINHGRLSKCLVPSLDNLAGMCARVMEHVLVYQLVSSACLLIVTQCILTLKRKCSLYKCP